MADRSPEIEACQRANGCNQDDDPDDWGVPCCNGCLCAEQAKGEAEPITAPWRPSNGTIGSIFYDDWCARCHRETGSRKCRIYTATLIHAVDEPDYPKEWVSDAAGGNARCTAFEKPHATRHSTIKDRRQEAMPL